MQKSIPLRTLLTLTAEVDGKTSDYTCITVGYGRYGLQVSLPQILDRVYSLPATTPLRCSFVSMSTNQLLAFSSYVMGYERTEPPLMVIAMPQAVEGHNRRNALRWPVRVDVGYIAEGKSAYGERTQTLDLSLTGLQMTTGRVLEKGTVLSVTLDLPEGTQVVTGEVVWSSFKGRRATAGVHFTRLGQVVEKALFKYLQSVERGVRQPPA